MPTLTPSVAFVTSTGSRRIWVQPWRIAEMERDLDAAIAKAREAGGTQLAIELFDPNDRLVVRRVVG